MSSKDKKKKKFLDSEQNRVVIITLEIALLLTIVVITCAVLRGDIISTLQEPSRYVLQSNLNSDESEYELQNKDEDKQNDILNDLLGGFGNDNNSGENKYEAQGNVGGEEYKPQNNAPQLPNPSNWSTADIINKAKQAVNKTKAYNKTLNVHHKESFDATVTECSGGSVVQSVVNVMVGWVVKPVDETLVFNNGYAVNSEDETVPIILPKKGDFSLSPNGVTSASARVSGGEYIINLRIKSESVGIGEVPIHNASSIGFLDVANFDISFMTVDRADISYTGSSIELHINEQGYVTYAAYSVPLEIDGAAHRGNISGSAVFVGEQSEIWTLNY